MIYGSCAALKATTLSSKPTTPTSKESPTNVFITFTHLPRNLQKLSRLTKRSLPFSPWGCFCSISLRVHAAVNIATECDNLYQKKQIDEAGLAKRLKELKYSES